MLKEISRSRLVGLWFAAVAVIIASVAAMGLTVAVSTTAFLLTLSLVPPAIMLLLWPAAPSPTVADILHAASSPKDGRV